MPLARGTTARVDADALRRAALERARAERARRRREEQEKRLQAARVERERRRSNAASRRAEGVRLSHLSEPERRRAEALHDRPAPPRPRPSETVEAIRRQERRQVPAARQRERTRRDVLRAELRPRNVYRPSPAQEAEAGAVAAAQAWQAGRGRPGRVTGAIVKGLELAGRGAGQAALFAHPAMIPFQLGDLRESAREAKRTVMDPGASRREKIEAASAI